MSLEKRLIEEFSQRNLKTYSQKEDAALRKISSKEKLAAYLLPSLGEKDDVSIENFIGNGGRQNIYKIRINRKYYAASIRKEEITEGETKQEFSLDELNEIEGIIPTFGIVRTKHEGEEFFYGTISKLIENTSSLEDYIQINGYNPEKNIKTPYLAKVLSYLSQILRSIHGLKEKKLVHRDFKNANILLQENKAFLTDFDLMQHEYAAINKEAVMGTTPYKSIEALQGELLDYRTDLYSWTVCLAEAVGFLNPNRYDETTPVIEEAVLNEIMNKEYLPKISDKRLRHLPGELIHPLKEVLANGLSPFRDMRKLDYITAIFNDPTISYYIDLANKAPKKSLLEFLKTKIL